MEVLRTPAGGLQPRAVVDGKGVLHLLSFHGDPRGGELEYRCSSDGGHTFGTPLRVNSRARDAVAIGNVRGAALALGRDGRVHVVWNGREPEGGAHAEGPLAYTRLDASGQAFEPTRDLTGAHPGLDGGSAVAADEHGNVWVLWHAPEGGPESPADEAHRRVFVAHSADDGGHFTSERAASPEGSGVCPCCGLGAAATGDGGLAVLYRTARDGVRRDATRLLARTPEGPFEAALVAPWRVEACVMSTFALARGPHGLLGAVEAEGQVRVSALEEDAPVSRSVPGEPAGRKHPSLACGADGSFLVAWIEGMSWGQGGTLVWQLHGPDGQPLEGEAGRHDGLPPWSLVQAVALPGGRYAVLF